MSARPGSDQLAEADAPEPFNWYLRSITFSGGETLVLDEGSLCLLIGPNSSGKSSALRGISQHIQNNAASRVVVGIEPTRTGTPEGMATWLDQRFPKKVISGTSHWSTKGSLFSATDVVNIWNQGVVMPGAHSFLTHLLDTDSRLAASKRTRSINVYQQAPDQYIHMVQSDDALAARLSSEIQDAFQTGVFVEWTGGQEVGFRVGTEPVRTVEVDRVSPEYAAELLRMPKLDEEGDGLRSFTGALLALRCGAHPVLLIDEPEAFLHPPQARRLGALLARAAADSGRQVIAATHSADVVRGALDERSDVAVCRITREGDVNHAAPLGATDLRALWSKPLLRSASAITGLFHRGVVVCEADSDVRLYETAVAGLEARGVLNGPVDVHFAQGGGKGELATLARAYRAVKVPVAVVADLDLLRNRAEFIQVLEALGSSYAGFEGRYKSLLSALGGLPPKRSPSDFVGRARVVLDEVDLSATALPNETKRQLIDLVEQASDWSDIKRQGIGLLRGGALTQAKDLLVEWESAGLFLVPVGELEGWWPEGPTSKRDWIEPALTQALDGQLTACAEFMARVVAFLRA